MKRPIVAIVGRPNVGKSTLFNRIIRRNEAIVDDMPGVTRDRKYAEAKWEGHSFDLVDTGGFNPKSMDVIETGVSAQVQIAIEEADSLVFVMDVTTPITNIDQMVIDLLRKSNKPVFLAVNKVDNQRRELDAAEFYQSGFPDMFTISATAGRGVGDLLSAVIRSIDWEGMVGEGESDDSLKLAIIGRPNAGKSTYINLILGEERLLVTEIPGTTRDTVDVRVLYKDRPVTLIDTAGMRRRARVKEDVEFYSVVRTRRALERCHIAAVFLDCSEGVTQQDMKVIQDAIDAQKGIVLVVNKWDLLTNVDNTLFEYKRTLDQKLQGLGYIPVVQMSCKDKMNLNEVLDLAFQINVERKKRVSTPDVNRLIEAINQRYLPPSTQGKRPKIQFGAQVGTEPPSFAFFLNYPNLLKPPYKKFVENQLREQFGFRGVPISIAFKKKMGSDE